MCSRATMTSSRCGRRGTSSRRTSRTSREVPVAPRRATASTPRAPRRWLLVEKEAGLADSEDAGGALVAGPPVPRPGRVPTLVEVKRSTDTRIRREVVGQMLDYAANAVVYLPIEQIRGWFDGAVPADRRDAADADAPRRSAPTSTPTPSGCRPRRTSRRAGSASCSSRTRSRRSCSASSSSSTARWTRPRSSPIAIPQFVGRTPKAAASRRSCPPSSAGPPRRSARRP